MTSTGTGVLPEPYYVQARAMQPALTYARVNVNSMAMYMNSG